MKKFTALIALSLCISLLCACGAKEQDPAEMTASSTSGASEATTASTESTGSALADLIANTEIHDISTLPMIYSQEDVCPEPSLKSYQQFAKCATPEFVIPGLNQTIVPQGMDYWEERNWMLISGYCTDESKNGGKGSALLAVDMSTGQMIGEYYLKNMDGTYHTSHAGGVAVTRKNVFIANGNTLYRIPLADLLPQCNEVTIVEEIKVPTRASLANCSGGILWVGDFQYSTSYPTDEFRHMKNRQGKMYYAWTVGYRLDETTENEFSAQAMAGGDFATPDIVLSMTERIQGMTYLPEVGQIALSQSYGRTNDSKLYFYEDPMEDAPHTTVTLNGVEVPVWFLDSKQNVKEMSAIPMSEGIANIGGKLYVLFESGANKYRLDGGKLPTDMVYAVDITKW